ncbi:MAG: PAS domain S-box protein [Azonexus sp.]
MSFFLPLPTAQAPRRTVYPIVLLFSALALVIVLLGWGIYAQQAHRFREQENAKLTAIAELKAHQIGNWLAERTSNADVLQGGDLQAEVLNHWLATGDAAAQKKIEDHFSSFVKAYHYQSLVLLDAQGAIRLQVGEPHLVTEELRHAAERAWREKRVVMTDLYLADLQPPEHTHLDFVVPAIGTNGIVLALRANPNQFLYPLIQSWPIPSASAETVLVRRDGDQVVFLNELRHRQGAALKLQLPLSMADTLPAARAVSAGGTGTMEGQDYRQAPVIAAYHDVPGTGWSVIAKVDRDELLMPLRDYALVIAVAVLVAIAAAAMGIFYFVRRNEEAHRFALQDIRLQDMEALRESEERFRATFEQAAVGIAHVAPDGHWTRVNQRLCDILGYTTDELLQRTFQDITHPDDLEADRDFERQMLAREISHYAMEKRYFRKDGSVVWTDLTVSLVWDAAGVPKYFIWVIEDISQRKAIQDELDDYREQLEKRVEERTVQLQAAYTDLESFSYSVSHDLRAPLRAIDGFSAILLEDYAPRLDDEGKRLFRVVGDNARKMGQLIDDILAFSRAGRIELLVTNLDMNALAHEVWQELEPQRAGRSVEFRLAALPTANADPAAIRQVLQNFLANALKFTRARESALIELGGHQDSGESIFYVRDNGAGFDMDYVNRLFGLFQRLHGMDEFEGTGVGLAIVKRFVAKHGGRVWAEGKLGEGATFWFTLPPAKSGAINKETAIG